MAKTETHQDRKLGDLENKLAIAQSDLDNARKKGTDTGPIYSYILRLEDEIKSLKHNSNSINISKALSSREALKSTQFILSTSVVGKKSGYLLKTL